MFSSHRMGDGQIFMILSATIAYRDSVTTNVFQAYRIGQNQKTAIGLRFFCASVGTILIFKIISQDVKSERKLNCSRAHQSYRNICETGNIEPMKSAGLKMDQPEKRLRGIQLRKFTELPECQIRRCNYRFYICVWHY